MFTSLIVVHILCAAFWAGASLFLAIVVGPVAGSLGPAGGSFMQKLTADARFSRTMGIAGTGTLISGLALYWLVSGHFSRGWIFSGPGIAISIGALAGIGAGLEGALIIERTAARLNTMIMAVEMRGAGSGDILAGDILATRNKLRRATATSSGLVLTALICMAIGRAL